ncbi:MAG: response regulator [Terriglobia bacterium]
MRRNPRILVVDDDAHIREALAQLLAMWGYESETASDGIEALEKIDSQAPDVVIADLHMPRMGGMDLIEALHISAPDMSCIVVTADGGSERVAQAARLGVVYFLEKPINPQVLQTDLQKCLEHSAVWT